MREVRLVMLVFFLQPIPLGAWLARIPEIEATLKLGPARLGLSLLGFPIGTIAALIVGGAVAERFGARGLIMLTFPAFLAAILLPPLAPGVAMLFLALAITGAVMGLLELAMNLEAARVETASGRLIMSTSHGFWSVGLALGTLIGTQFANRGTDPFTAALIVSTVLLLPALAVSRTLPNLPRENGGGGHVFALPSRPAIPICLFVLGVAMTEGALADWAGIFLRDAIGTEIGLTGYGFGIFASAVAFGRFFGDFLKARLGAARLARFCLVCALAGLALLGFVDTLPLSLLAFALLGIGVSTGFPLAVSAISAIDPARVATNVSALGLAALGSFLVGPVLIGFLAEVFGIRPAMMALAPALLGSLVLAHSLKAAKD
ncbi:MAG: MFS transporter [Proteobacteria bacterium]|nr:MFS transporter [Pseudomonadota bacterium]